MKVYRKKTGFARYLQAREGVKKEPCKDGFAKYIKAKDSSAGFGKYVAMQEVSHP